MDKNIPVDSILIDFGFSEVEVSVYKAALVLGSRPASVIAQKAGLKRSHTYNVLDSLMKKGVMQEFVKNSVRQFTCSPPQSLLSILERRRSELDRQKQQLEEIIPQLESLCNPLSRPRVRFYQGVDGVKEIYEDMISVPERHIYGVCDARHNFTFVSTLERSWINDFINRRAERGIWWYGIVAASEESMHELAVRVWKNREVRLLSNTYIGVTINIYGEKVAITSTNEETIGILIENETIAATLKSFHQTAWNLLPRYPQPESRNGIASIDSGTDSLSVQSSQISI